MKMFEIKNSIILIDNSEDGQDFVRFSGTVQISSTHHEHENKYLIKNDAGQLIYARCYKNGVSGEINEGTEVSVEGFVTGICRYYTLPGNIILVYADKITSSHLHQECFTD